MPKIFIELFLRKSVSWRLKIHSFKVVQFSQSVYLKKHVGCPTSHLCVRWYRYLSYSSIVIWLKTPLRGWKCMYHHNGSNWHCMTPNGPNDPKTLPMGILHDYMSCWTTLGPFQRPTGAPKWPKTAPKMALHDPKWPFMTQNVPVWPQMALKHFPREYYMILCHVGPPWDLSEAHWGNVGLWKGPREVQYAI